MTALRGEGVVWFDLTNSFSPERVVSIAASILASDGTATEVGRPRAIHTNDLAINMPLLM